MTQTVPINYFVRAYLRASTLEQDAQRARTTLDSFARERGVTICNYYAENESGARLNRPELFRLLADSRPLDVLLVEDVDRLSRLATKEWENLKSIIRQRDVRVVAVNVPTTWMHLAPAHNEFDARMFGAINEMLMDMLAAIARRDYEQRRERQSQGIAKAKTAGKYRGRQVDKTRYDAINRLLASGSSWSVVQRTVGCSRSTISSARKHASVSTVQQTPVSLPENAAKSVAVILWLYFENGSKFTRGKKRVYEEVENMLRHEYRGAKLKGHSTEYRVVFEYEDGADLKEQIEELISGICDAADMRNCMVEYGIRNEENGAPWDECDGVWRPDLSCQRRPS